MGKQITLAFYFLHVCNGKKNSIVKFGVPVFRCSEVFLCSGVFRCSGAFRCSGVPAFRGVPVFRCSGVAGCSGVPVFLVLVHAAPDAVFVFTKYFIIVSE